MSLTKTLYPVLIVLLLLNYMTDFPLTLSISPHERKLLIRTLSNRIKNLQMRADLIIYTDFACRLNKPKL